MQSFLLAVLAAAVAAWLFGAAYYGLLGRVWRSALDIPASVTAAGRPPLAALWSSFLAELLMAVVLGQVLQHMSVVGWDWGALSGFWIGLGLLAPVTVVNNLYPGRKPLLSLVDAGHWLGVALIQGMILGALA